MTVEVKRLAGPDVETVLADLARLRIEVFRDWPYLYDGTFDYEERYLAKLVASRDSVVIAALDNGRIVGAATGGPLSGTFSEFMPTFLAAGFSPERIFYFGESVLLKAYRGRGLGHAFFDAREAHARSLGGFTHTAFCGVVRPEDHPARPAAYRPLDAFWSKRGYTRLEGGIAMFPWKDIGESEETDKPMQFWIRPLEPSLTGDTS